MEVIRSLTGRKRHYKNAVVALGVFDGVHRAHRRILQGVIKQAKRIRGRSMVLTFWPHPQRKQSIYSLEHRLKLLSEIGIDVCAIIKFDRRFSRISAEDFVKEILVKKINARYVYVGRNFRFGRRAGGGLHTLCRLSRIYNFRVKAFKTLSVNKQPISSTYIRRLVIRGDLESARKLLSRPVSILGTVIKGDSLGRYLGFPTANINPHHEVLPPSGVYAVYVLLNNRRFSGICYIGKKPTFRKSNARGSRRNKKVIEVYIFGFKRNIYGRYLQIQFRKKIREDKRFSSMQALVKQIRKDVKLARKR